MENQNDVLKYVPASVEDEDNLLKSALAVLHKRIDKVGEKQTPESMKDYLKLAYGGKFEHERFGIVMLDLNYRLIGTTILAEGTFTSTAVAPREVLKAALAANAAYVVLFHTHPAQDPTPSDADVAMTFKLLRALQPAEIEVLDHMVIAGDQVVSMGEKGLLSNKEDDDRLKRLIKALPMLGS